MIPTPSCIAMKERIYKKEKRKMLGYKFDEYTNTILDNYDTSYYYCYRCDKLLTVRTKYDYENHKFLKYDEKCKEQTFCEDFLLSVYVEGWTYSHSNFSFCSKECCKEFAKRFKESKNSMRIFVEKMIEEDIDSFKRVRNEYKDKNGNARIMPSLGYY